MTTPKQAPKFASRTQVTQEQTISQLRALLRKYGAAERFAHGDEPGRSIIGFKRAGREYRFELPMPTIEEFAKTASGMRRSEAALIKAWLDESNRRYRALLATIKGRLIAVGEGVSTFEAEFALETVLPNGQTVREYTLPQIEAAYRDGKMPALLPGSKV